MFHLIYHQKESGKETIDKRSGKLITSLFHWRQKHNAGNG